MWLQIHTNDYTFAYINTHLLYKFLKTYMNFYNCSSYCLSSCNYRLKQATKKVVAKPAVPSGPTIKTVTSSKPGQNVVVKRPPGAIVNVSSKHSVVPKPVLKFTSSSKVSRFFILYPTFNRAHRGNLVLRHSVPFFLPNFRGTAC